MCVQRERETIGAFDAFAKRTQAQQKVVLNEKRVKFGAVSKVALAGTVQQRTEVQRKLETGASSVLVGALESWMGRGFELFCIPKSLTFHRQQ